METFMEWLETIKTPEHRERAQEVLQWVMDTYPDLGKKIAWNAPHFTDHGTFIIAFSASSKHLAVAPEYAGIEHFSEQIKAAGYEHSMMLLKFPWNKPVDYALLGRIIDFNIEEKKDVQTYWRKNPNKD
jgi:hypothetical protein